MSDDRKTSPFTTLKPIDLAGNASADKAEVAAPQQIDAVKLVWILVFAILILAAIFVLLVLPALVGTSDSSQSSSQQSASKPSSGVPSTVQNRPNTVSPYQQTLAASYRSDAQDILRQVTDIQLELENLQVMRWAAEKFIAARTAAERGDELFKIQSYQEAKGEYESALATMQELIEGWPDTKQSFLAAIQSSIAANDLQTAKQQLQEFLLIDPENAEAQALGQKISLYPRLLTLLVESEALEQSGDLQGALGKAREAVSLQKTFLPALVTVRRLRTTIQNNAFQTAMARGLLALREKAFQKALKAFREAQAIKPGPEPAAGLQEAESGIRLAKIQALQKEADRAEQEEDWEKTGLIYNRILAQDPTLAESQKKLVYSKHRAQLHKKIENILARPIDLSDERAHQKGQEVLRLASKLRPRGAVLANQLQRLETALKLALQSVQVTLTSDNATSVQVLRIANLGTFKTHEIALKPGEYRMQGSRRGYRDVLHIVRLRPGNPPISLDIRCEEKI